ncbi:hypothetical protein SUGI_0191980 [Cryptomeria japonica]|nr:hypothetical protein SUGI_0191980 [Cryptomeria japonica]
MDLGTLCKQGRLREALQLLNGMDNCLKPSTYASLLRLCTGKKFLAGGKLVHQHMDRMGFKPDMFLRNTMTKTVCPLSLLYIITVCLWATFLCSEESRSAT